MRAERHPGTKIIAMQSGKNTEITVKFRNFADGDTHCLIEDTEHIPDAKVLVFHYLYPNQNEQIFRLLLLLNTLNVLGAKDIEVFVPYLPYARQDKAHFAGESISSAILCRLLKASGCETLHTIDCHFMKGNSSDTIEELKINNILVKDLLLEQLGSLTNDTYRVIGPDAGSAYLSDGATMKKARAAYYNETEDGTIHRAVETLDSTHLKVMSGSLVVADDMVSTGSTMIKALESLRSRGVERLYVMTTHGLFLDESFEKIRNYTTDVIYSDTISREGAVPVVDTIFHRLTQSL